MNSILLPRFILLLSLGMYTLSEAWSGVNWADLMAAQGAFGTDFYDRWAFKERKKFFSYFTPFRYLKGTNFHFDDIFRFQL